MCVYRFVDVRIGLKGGTIMNENALQMEKS